MRKCFTVVMVLALMVFVLGGCASMEAMHEDRMEERVDNIKVIDIGRDNRGLVLRFPRPTEPGESIFEAVLGWSREYIGIAGIPVDENDTGRYMRGSNMSASGENVLDGKMGDVLLIEVVSGANPAVEDEAEIVEPDDAAENP